MSSCWKPRLARKLEISRSSWRMELPSIALSTSSRIMVNSLSRMFVLQGGSDSPVQPPARPADFPLDLELEEGAGYLFGPQPQGAGEALDGIFPRSEAGQQRALRLREGGIFRLRPIGGKTPRGRGW